MTDHDYASLYARADKWIARATAELQRSIEATEQVFDRMTADAVRLPADRAAKILAR